MKNHPLDSHIARLIRRRRILRGMSQTELGKAVGVSFQQIQKYELGRNVTSVSKLFDIAAALGVPVTSFFEEMPKAAAGVGKRGLPKGSATDVEEDQMGKLAGLRLARSFEKIEDQRVRRYALGLIEALASKR